MRETFESRSPADPADLIGQFDIADAEDVERCVARARHAFAAWRDTSQEARAGVLRRFAELASGESEALARLVAREVGKALWDARAEARLLAAKIDVTLEEGLRLVAPIEAGAGVRATLHPRGVLAVLAPFNFPLHLANGHIAPALATGNCVILKPSELAPGCGERLGALLRQAGAPDGVIQVVHGGAETGRQLAAHPDVDAVLFTGSYAVGNALARATLDQPDKLLALEMGGSNAILVLDDAALDAAVAETALSIAATTGQRCTSARRIFVQRGIEAAFVEKLAGVLRGLAVGNPLDEGVFMGPLVSARAAEAVDAARAAAATAGGERILGVEPQLPPPYVGAGLVRWPSLTQDTTVQREELFGPEAHVYAIADLDEGIVAANDTEYGLAASIFTRDRSAYEHCVGRIRVGCLNWNRATVGASGKLPFGGRGRSGNDRPTGVGATVYCTVPQAHLESEANFDATALPPGMPRP
ncbi:MAG: aldehyde dehydrogenase family protein [Deltaproteobacteria bacterium]|nr:aldehyde dehydrogenase family protein [Deltaproteobacteria bacterium]